MKSNHYELIKLQFELIELYPYEKDNSVDIMTKEDFDIEQTINGWEAYLKSTDVEELQSLKPADGVDEELSIYRRAETLLRELKLELLYDTLDEEDIDYNEQFSEINFAWENFEVIIDKATLKVSYTRKNLNSDLITLLKDLKEVR